MPINKSALIRYKTIDKCLQNKYRKWSLENLINECSDALYEYEGRDVSISKRTIQLDIQNMRSSKLGYSAPIEVYDKKYYRYGIENYTITNIPLTDIDISVLTETLTILRQFKDFSLFEDVADIIQRLEDKIYAEKTHSKPVIILDKNEKLKGLEYLEVLYQAIIKKITLLISYKSFTARNPSQFLFFPYILKEYNNRWFLFGKKANSNSILNLALDRIESINFDLSIDFLEDNNFDSEEYFKDVIGVTVNHGMSPRVIKIWVDPQNAPYVLTKPIHPSQKLMKTHEDHSITVQLYLKVNFELERILMGFSEGIFVISPRSLNEKIKEKLKKSYERYLQNPIPFS